MYVKFQATLRKARGKLPYERWLQRVRNWCANNDITLRKPNDKHLSEGREELLTKRCLGTTETLEQRMSEQNISEEEVANMDETSMRVFSLDIRTLHWKGGKRVPVAQCFRSVNL